jgi:cytoskeleton protein RodZ
LTEAIGVGARLRQAREAQGLAIDDVAQQLKFAPRQIESLEQERFDRLPGPTIARGMVRNYARLLRLDPDPLIERMAPQAEKTHDPGLTERFRKEVPFSEGGKRSTLIYAGFSIGILVLVAAVAYEWQQEKATPQFVAPAREEPAPAPSPAPVAAAPVAPPPVEEKKVDLATVAPAKPAPPPAAPVEAQKPAATAMQRIVVRAEEDAWVEIRDASGRTLVATLAPAGSERAVQGRAPFELVIGNAASVKLTYEGKPVDLRPHTRVSVARLKLK